MCVREREREYVCVCVFVCMSMWDIWLGRMKRLTKDLYKVFDLTLIFCEPVWPSGKALGW